MARQAVEGVGREEAITLLQRSSDVIRPPMRIREAVRDRLVLVKCIWEEFLACMAWTGCGVARHGLASTRY
jgi:hypothetical protein